LLTGFIVDAFALEAIALAFAFVAGFMALAAVLAAFAIWLAAFAMVFAATLAAFAIWLAAFAMVLVAVLVLVFALFVAASPQAIPKALITRTADRAITFFISIDSPVVFKD